MKYTIREEESFMPSEKKALSLFCWINKSDGTENQLAMSCISLHFSDYSGSANIDNDYCMGFY